MRIINQKWLLVDNWIEFILTLKSIIDEHSITPITFADGRQDHPGDRTTPGETARILQMETTGRPARLQNPGIKIEGTDHPMEGKTRSILQGGTGEESR